MEKLNSRVILVVGHQKSSPGAENASLKIAEWDFNFVLVKKIWEIVRKKIEASFLYPDVPHWQKASIINAENQKTPSDFVIEFHLNCAPQERVNYCLAKVPRGNPVSAKIGILLVSAIEKMGVKKATWGPPDMRVPGIFEADKPSENGAQGWRTRGSNFLFKPNLPTVLLETFFISNTEFLKEMMVEENSNRLADALSGAILDFYK